MIDTVAAMYSAFGLETMADTAALLGALISIIGIPLTFILGRRASRRTTIEVRLRDLSGKIREGAELLEEAEAEIKARVLAAERASQQARDAEIWKEQTQEERDAFDRLSRESARRETNRAILWSIPVGFFFYILGLVTKPIIDLVKGWLA